MAGSDVDISNIFTEDGKVVNYPTFGLTYGVNDWVHAGFQYSSNSVFVGQSNEWQPFVRVTPVRGVADGLLSAGFAGAWNAATDSFDGEVAVQADVGSLSLLAAACSAPPPSLNVVLIVIDDMGWTDAAVYGSTFYETPNIAELAARGARFTQFYTASPVCSPTRASLMTGKHPARLDLTNWIGGEQNGLLTQASYVRQLPLEEVAHPQHGGLGLPARHHQLHPIAGGDDDGLLDLIGRGELAQHGLGRVDGEAFADLERCRPVVHAEKQELHASSSAPSTANPAKTKESAALTAQRRAPRRAPKRSVASTT